MDFGFRERIYIVTILTIWKYTCGKARDDFLNIHEVCCLKDIVIDENVVTKKCKLLLILANNISSNRACSRCATYS